MSSSLSYSSGGGRGNANEDLVASLKARLAKAEAAGTVAVRGESVVDGPHISIADVTKRLSVSTGQDLKINKAKRTAETATTEYGGGAVSNGATLEGLGQEQQTGKPASKLTNDNWWQTKVNSAREESELAGHQARTEPTTTPQHRIENSARLAKTQEDAVLLLKNKLRSKKEDERNGSSSSGGQPDWESFAMRRTVFQAAGTAGHTAAGTAAHSAAAAKNPIRGSAHGGVVGGGGGAQPSMVVVQPQSEPTARISYSSLDNARDEYMRSFQNQQIVTEAAGIKQELETILGGNPTTPKSTSSPKPTQTIPPLVKTSSAEVMVVFQSSSAEAGKPRAADSKISSKPSGRVSSDRIAGEVPADHLPQERSFVIVSAKNSNSTTGGVFSIGDFETSDTDYNKLRKDKEEILEN